jgi:uncharacterized lipoprotein YmbA
MRKRIDAAFLTTVVLSLAGCSILKPQVDMSRFYLLTATTSRAGSAESRAPSDLTIGLGPVRFPDYLDRSQLVTRLGPNRVVFSDFERWAEPLDRNFSRVLIENLVRLLDTEKIIYLPALVSIPVQYQVPIEVQRFEGDGQGNVELVARWAIRSSAGDKLVRTGESHITEKGGSKTEDVVAALSRAAGKLSEEIADALRQVSQPS